MGVGGGGGENHIFGPGSISKTRSKLEDGIPRHLPILL